jgi:NADH:quinone reductase (non-electrogenic)
VTPDLSLPEHSEVFVIGDPAQVARVIAARIAGKRPPAPFRYRDFGNLATIGRREAVVDFGRLRLTGRVAWFVWGLAHIYIPIGFRNRMAVAVDWLWSYVTYQRGARLITGEKMRKVTRFASKR